MMSVTEAIRELARFARETRANLMARVQIDDGPRSEMFATLHPPGLTLLEAALASPAKAQQLDQVWMQDHLLKAFVELHAGHEALEALSDGDVRRVALVDEQGQRTGALYMTVRSDSGGWTYRFYFDPLVFDPERERMKLTFELPLTREPDTARGSVGRAHWQMSHEMLSGMDELPLLYLMRRTRAVRLGRWAVLTGEVAQARELLADELACAPDLEAARTLLGKLDRLATAPRVETLTVAAKTLSGVDREQLGHDPARDLALRAELLARLSPLASVGVVGAQGVKRCQEALRSAAVAAAGGDVWASSSAQLDFDRSLAAMLAAALDGQDGPAEQVATLALRQLPKVGEQEVTRELERRVIHANYDLVPRWIKGPKGFTAEDGRVSRVHLLELHPVAFAESGKDQVVAELQQRMGWGWVHPGLPAERYHERFVDHSEEYWRGEVARVKPATSLEAHRELARRLLARELHSPSAEAARLATAGVVQQGPKALDQLLPLLERGPAARRAALLQAVALVRDQRVSQAIGQAARASDPKLRAGAMAALGARGLSAELAQLRAGLEDSDPRVAEAAMVGLLSCGDPTGLVQARRWLMGGDQGRRELILTLPEPAARQLKKLSRELQQLARAADPPLSLPSALARALGGQALPHLTRMYNTARSNVPLRAAVQKNAEGHAFERLLVLGAQDKEVQVRQHALLNLARLKAPPEGVLRQMSTDGDPLVRVAAHVGLARLGRVESLLTLGQAARGSCRERAAVLPVLCQSMDNASRGRLLIDALSSGCEQLLPLALELGLRYQAGDVALLRAAMSHTNRTIRVRGALAVLGLRSEPSRMSALTPARPRWAAVARRSELQLRFVGLRARLAA